MKYNLCISSITEYSVSLMQCLSRPHTPLESGLCHDMDASVMDLSAVRSGSTTLLICDIGQLHCTKLQTAAGNHLLTSGTLGRLSMSTWIAATASPRLATLIISSLCHMREISVGRYQYATRSPPIRSFGAKESSSSWSQQVNSRTHTANHTQCHGGPQRKSLCDTKCASYRHRNFCT